MAVPLAEKELIAGIRRLAGRNALTARVGIGDDCAVLRTTPGSELLVTTDFSLEGIHFRRDWHPAESVGHRCLARGLSDIAAMGGEPVEAFLSLALPKDLEQKWVDRFFRGLTRLAKEYGVTLAGGDTAESPGGILADIVVVGRAPKGKAILRSGARMGDRIFVSGELGGSAAAVEQSSRSSVVSSQSKRAGERTRLNPRDYPRHFYPEPRVGLGRVLLEKGLATSMIDTSDGLSTDLAHICEESGVGAEIAIDLIPRASVGRPAREVSPELALHGGEDYELLFTVRPGKRIPARIAGVRVTEIGVITKARKMILRRAGEDARPDSRRGRRRYGVELIPQGWEHFRR